MCCLSSLHSCNYGFRIFFFGLFSISNSKCSFFFFIDFICLFQSQCFEFFFLSLLFSFKPFDERLIRSSIFVIFIYDRLRLQAYRFLCLFVLKCLFQLFLFNRCFLVKPVSCLASYRKLFRIALLQRPARLLHLRCLFHILCFIHFHHLGCLVIPSTLTLLNYQFKWIKICLWLLPAKFNIFIFDLLPQLCTFLLYTVATLVLIHLIYSPIINLPAFRISWIRIFNNLA